MPSHLQLLVTELLKQLASCQEYLLDIALGIFNLIVVLAALIMLNESISDCSLWFEVNTVLVVKDYVAEGFHFHLAGLVHCLITYFLISSQMLCWNSVISLWWFLWFKQQWKSYMESSIQICTCIRQTWYLNTVKVATNVHL